MSSLFIHYVPDGFDLVQGACKPRINVRAPCNVRSFCSCWAAACLTRRQCHRLDDQGIFHQIHTGEKFSLILKPSRQHLRPAQPTIQPMLRVKWLGENANCLSLSNAGEECVELHVVYLHTPLYHHHMVLNETWRQVYLI